MTEMFVLRDEKARRYFEFDPDIEIGPGDRVFVEVNYRERWATSVVVPEGENPANYVSEDDDYDGVIRLLIELDYRTPKLIKARRDQLGLSLFGSMKKRLTMMMVVRLLLK